MTGTDLVVVAVVSVAVWLFLADRVTGGSGNPSDSGGTFAPSFRGPTFGPDRAINHVIAGQLTPL